MKFYKPKFWDKKQFSFFSTLLLPAALLIKILIFFKVLFSKKYNCSIPVICVGNIYLGGTGKTPFCAELFFILKNLEKNPSFIRKKYENYEDEINLLKKIGPVYENKKRASAINEAIKNSSNIVILDDGFQDHSVTKKLSIVCFNEKQWIGNGLTIPAGPLREGLSSLTRAHCVILNGRKNIQIERKILEKNKNINIFYSEYKAINADEFIKQKVIAFAGIGNPNNFFDLLEYNNINPIEKIAFPDHYKYSKKELESLANKADNNNAILLTTEKDYLRINSTLNKNIKFLKIKVEIKNRNKFIEEIKKFI